MNNKETNSMLELNNSKKCDAGCCKLSYELLENGVSFSLSYGGDKTRSFLAKDPIFLKNLAAALVVSAKLLEKEEDKND